MSERELKILLNELRALPNETEWLEFKVNNNQELGEYVSALSNSACLHDKPYGYIAFGVDDTTYRVVGTNFDLNQKGKGKRCHIKSATDILSWKLLK